MWSKHILKIYFCRLGYPSEVVRIKAGAKSVSVGIAAARGSTMPVEPTDIYV